ncbi:MAG TPA: ubiquitin-like domain-containing protein, partial [Actinomycetales bacterium]|nr:ubiquitin-like domain-containing protein [Actinomycetales bacterium]
MSVPGENYVRITVLKLPKSRAVRLGAQAAVLTALVAGTAAYAANDTTVQLTVDGKEQDVRVFGRTVDDVLKAADVDVSKRDVVAPALGERISEGSDVVVRHARLLTLTVDGETQQHWTTALTVDEAL